jgi:mono/diheme cytochrome c family protein
MKKSGIIGGVVAVLLVGGAAAAFAIAWRPAIAATEPAAKQRFDPVLVKRGREIAALGNCSSCHTVRGAKNFAGGLPVPTPFGTVFSSNITPDPETGIGRWPEQAFRRAMRSGVDREGRHLYPTFPYDHFTNVNDDDDRALYAFLMTREPVSEGLAVPEAIDVHIINRPGQPFLGSGETGQGPAEASLANAIANATGKRLRNLPLTRKRIKDAINA